MVKRKSFTAPLYFLTLVVLVQLLFLYFLMSLYFEMASYEKSHPIKEVPGYAYPKMWKIYYRQSIQTGVTILLLIIEGLCLWFVRKKTYYKALTIGYLFPLIYLLAFLPFIAVHLRYFTRLIVPVEALFWWLMTISHLFLVAILIQAYFFQTKPEPSPENILDDYAEL